MTFPKYWATWRGSAIILGGGFKYILFHLYLGKISNLTDIFQLGWNHQPVYFLLQKSTQHLFSMKCMDQFLRRLLSSDKTPRAPGCNLSQMEVFIPVVEYPVPQGGVGTQRPHLAGRVALGHLHIFRVSYWVSTPGVMKLCPTWGETRASKYGSR